MGHGCGAQARLVGENAPLHTPADHQKHRAHRAAGDSVGGEGAHKNIVEHLGQGIRVVHDDRQAGQDVDHRHEGHQLLRHSPQALHAAEEHNGRQHGQHNAQHQVQRLLPGKIRLESQNCRVDGPYNVAGLNGVARSQRSQGRENAKEDAQPFPVLSQTVFNIVHGAAHPVPVLVPLPELDRQEHLRILGGHANEGRDPQPKQRTRAAQGHRSGDAGDVSRAHRAGQGRGNGLEGGNLPLPRVGFVKDFADGILHGIAELPELQSPVPHGHENPDADEQHQHGGAPHKAVHRTVDLCNQFHTLLPFRV